MDKNAAQLSVRLHLDIGSLRFRREEVRSASDPMFVALLFSPGGRYLGGRWKRLALRLSSPMTEQLAASGIDQGFHFDLRPGTYFVRGVAPESEEGHLAALNSVGDVPF
jgi:hypothetical protein